MSDRGGAGKGTGGGSGMGSDNAPGTKSTSRERAADRPPILLRSLSVRNLRSYASLDVSFEPGPQLIWGPNAAGKTTLLEAIVVLALGRSHRTATDAELVRWGAEYIRVEGRLSSGDLLEVTLDRSAGSAGRKKVQVNGVPRRAGALAEQLRVVLFAPEEMLLVVGPPALRRTALDVLAAQYERTYAADLATYGRALQQRNGLLRQIREGEADREQLRYWDQPLLTAGGAVVEARLRVLAALAEPLADAHAEIAPGEGRLGLRYLTNAPAHPGESPRDALARRLRETADKEVWNGTTLVGPHRDDLAFELDGRDLAGFASRGQQRTSILAFKLAQVDLLSSLDGRPPILLLDDVFSELDHDRRSHLVRRIAMLPQAFVTTTDPTDLDAQLRARSHCWRVDAGGGPVAAEREGSGAGGSGGANAGSVAGGGMPASARVEAVE